MDDTDAQGASLASRSRNVPRRSHAETGDGAPEASSRRWPASPPSATIGGARPIVAAPRLGGRIAARPPATDSRKAGTRSQGRACVRHSTARHSETRLDRGHVGTPGARAGSGAGRNDDPRASRGVWLAERHGRPLARNVRDGELDVGELFGRRPEAPGHLGVLDLGGGVTSVTGPCAPEV